MRLEGGCCCGALRYKAEGEPVLRAQCHCRECQYISGGLANLILGMPAASFVYTKGSPRQFKRADLASPVTHEFCVDCGTGILSRAPDQPGAVLIKVGTFDDPSLYDGPQMAIFTIDKQRFHQLPPGVPAYERLPS